jgi:hypothetical protein
MMGPNLAIGRAVFSLEMAFRRARREVRNRETQLAEAVKPETAIAFLERLTIEEKAPLLEISRYITPFFFKTSKINRVVREYPHLALAHMEKYSPQILRRLRSQIDEGQSELDRLRALAEILLRPLPQVEPS